MLAAVLGSSCREPPSAWTCKTFGQERRCEMPLPVPGAGAWECYAADDDVACFGPGGAASSPSWDCAPAAGSVLCILAGAARPDEPSPDGWQCFAENGRLVCDWRRYGNDAWACSGETCRETHPDMPSSDEWECIEKSWGVLCRGRFLRDTHPRWTCVPYEERFLCLDLDRDVPPSPGPWDCRYDNSMRTGRICTRKPADACASCPGRCVGGTCYPAFKAPLCYFDSDCTDGTTCVMGACTKP
jgi:hypothetical protein